MKLELRRVTVPTPGAQDARRQWPERESLLLRLTDAEGRSGIGEASPLPGYSPDVLGDVESALATVATSDIQAALALAPREALGAVARLVPVSLPSARMALETAALDLLGVRQRRSAPILLGALPGATRPLAQLLGPAHADGLVEAAVHALRGGFRHLKLKLGAPGKLEAEVAAVAAVRRHLGAAVSLRLDANGSLSAAEIEAAWTTLAGLDIELFEEPGVLPEGLRGAFPLALDESLHGLSESEVVALLQRSQARSVVLKPMALGGLEYCLRLAERAHDLGLGVVISHCFDGPFAFRAAAALALALPAGLAHGLGPHAGLAAWSGAELPVREGSLELWQDGGLAAATEHGFP